jgi:hypothetical protein
MIIQASFIPARGMALCPFILIKHNEDLGDIQLIRHEKIHIRQQIELLIIPFYIWYFLEYLVLRLKGHGHYSAYLNICFEKEAFANDHDVFYLQKRKWGSFLKYLLKDTKVNQ